MDVSTVQVARWKRYGKDRLYVTSADETRLGFWDLLTDEAHPESPEHLAVLLDAVENWKTKQAGEVPVSPPAKPRVLPEPDADAVTPVVADAEPEMGAARAAPTATGQRPWLDLASNQAGAAAREQAHAVRDAAPVKSLLARALRVHTDERAWRIGADGEELVAAQLRKAAKKDPRWRFLHAIPVGTRGSDIDHLVIGPGGVFTVNAKHHPRANIWVGGNTFMVDGHKQPYLRNSRHEAARAADLLTAACGFLVHVDGLIVTVNAADITVKSTPAGVHVVPRMQRAQWLLRHGEVHTTDTIDAIFEVARRSTTWQP